MLEFDEFQLDIAARTLRRGGNVVHLAPKLFDLLALLVQRRGNTVDKDEILRVVWPGVVVEESGLARNVSLLRKALGEEDTVRFISTVPKRGYRFVAEVRETSVAPALRPRRRFRVPLLLAAGALLLAAAAIAWLRRETPATQPAFRALTSNAAEQAVDAAAIAPDGSYLAYYDLSGLYVRPTGSQEARRIEIPASLLPTQLEWFPDKAHLLASAFDQAAGKSSAWSIPVLGGAPALLHEDASYATASPDGKQIAFISRANQIWLANADGSAPRVFVALPAIERVAGRLQFTSDGKYLLNGRAFLNAAHVFIEARRLADGAVTQLLELPLLVLDFHLLPDGEMVIARSADVNALDTVLESHRVDVGQGFGGPPVELARYPATWVYGMSATDDGHRLTFVKDPAQSDVYVADLAPSGDAISNFHRLTFDDARDRPTAWLADNRHLVFHSNRGGQWGIYLQAIDESAAQVFVPGDGQEVWASVSPDQKWLYYMAGKQLNMGPDFNYDVMRLPLAGGPPEIVSPGRTFRRVRCPRNGTRCVLMENAGEQRVFYALDTEHGIGAELARAPWTPDWLFDWDVSPDGEHIAMVDPEGVHDHLLLISLERGKPVTTRLRVAGFQSLFSVNWDLNGTGLYVSSTDTLAGGLLHVTLDGRAKFMRRQVDGEGWAIPSPDGKHLAIQEWTIAGNVWELRR